MKKMYIHIRRTNAATKTAIEAMLSKLSMELPGTPIMFEEEFASPNGRVQTWTLPTDLAASRVKTMIVAIGYDRRLIQKVTVW